LAIGVGFDVVDIYDVGAVYEEEAVFVELSEGCLETMKNHVEAAAGEEDFYVAAVCLDADDVALEEFYVLPVMADFEMFHCFGV